MVNHGFALRLKPVVTADTDIPPAIVYFLISGLALRENPG